MILVKWKHCSSTSYHLKIPIEILIYKIINKFNMINHFIIEILTYQLDSRNQDRLELIDQPFNHH